MNCFDIQDVVIKGDPEVGGSRLSAIYEGKEIGYIDFEVLPDYEGEPAYAIPKIMNVIEEYRNKGVATKLIKEMPIKVLFNPDVGNTEEIHYSDEGRSFMEHCIEIGIARIQEF